MKKIFLKRYSFPILLLILLGSIFCSSRAQDAIRLNQIGFYPYGPKTAIIVSPQTWYFSLKSPDLKQTYYSGELTPNKLWDPSGENVKIADFSKYTKEGTYVVYVSGIGASYPFKIGKQVNETLVKGLIKAFYFQRASIALPSQYAGKWSRPAGTPDNRVVIHESAASDPTKPGARSAGETYSSPKGWYDAGDYGKYVVNAGITTYTLLLLYQQFSTYFDKVSLNIPESDNSLPDLLDEIKWELDWLLTMQDPSDGGVYHKLTGLNFDGMVMPSDVDEERYFIGKSSAATFDFAAVCAFASKVYKKFLPAFSDSCLIAAKYAWQWGTANKDHVFRGNPSGVITGTYADANSSDEHFWAGVELFLSTGDSSYYNAIKDISGGSSIPGWPSVGMLGNFSMALFKDDSVAQNRILSSADYLLNELNSSAFRISMRSDDFYWGSNGVAANQGMVMLVAYLKTREYKYLSGAIQILDYLLGRNGSGSSYVTGFGGKSPHDPHHRISVADGVADPVPGLLVGGPNPQKDPGENCQIDYSPYRAKHWLDKSCSYTTNEIAINWNAPIAFIAGGLEAMFNSSGIDLQSIVKLFQPDTEAAQLSLFKITGVSADNVVLSLKTNEPAVITIEYSEDSQFVYSQKKLVDCNDSSITVVKGLIPSKKYFIRCYSTDNNGNVSRAEDTFITSVSPLYSESLYKPTVARYEKNSDLSIKFTNSSGISARLIYSTGGSSHVDTIVFSENEGSYGASIPGVKVTNSGITYSIFLEKENDLLLTPQRGVAPDSIQDTTFSFSYPDAYNLISFPYDFKPVSSYTSFSRAFGDPSGWRYFGFDSKSGMYVQNDTIRSCSGGWFYNRKKQPYIHLAKGFKPDTLITVILSKGWNCISNPFPFPIYWDNLLIQDKGALLKISDTAASLFVRRQFFGYKDSSSDMKNNGSYFSNRDLLTHEFTDSAKLIPWEAYWVYAEKDSVVCLFNPEAVKGKGALSKKRAGLPEFWSCSFKAECDGIVDDFAVLGTSEGALDGYDSFDSPKPPSISSDLQIGFSHPEWNTYKSLFAVDIAAFRENGSHEWSLKIRTPIKKMVKITWKNTGHINGSLYLKDLCTGRFVDMNKSDSYTLSLNQDETERNINVGWTSDIIPPQGHESQWSFSRLPYSGLSSFIIKYTVPVSVSRPCQIAVSVYDIQGRCIRRLVNESKKSGSYIINWDGANSRGLHVSKGIYIARLSSSRFSGNIKLSVFK